MTLRLVPDDDDSMAANPEPPRKDIGYSGRENRSRYRPTGGDVRWSFVEIDARRATTEAESGGRVGGQLKCAPRDATYPGCGEPATVLHADPRNGEPRRTLCGLCQGAILRERIGGGR